MARPCTSLNLACLVNRFWPCLNVCAYYICILTFCRAMRVHVCDVAHSAVGTLGGCNVCTACSPRKGLPHELLLRVLGTKSSLRLWIGSATSGGGDSLVVGAIVVPLVSVVAAADPAEELVILSSNFCNCRRTPHRPLASTTASKSGCRASGRI